MSVALDAARRRADPGAARHAHHHGHDHGQPAADSIEPIGVEWVAERHDVAMPVRRATPFLMSAPQRLVIIAIALAAMWAVIVLALR